MRLGLWLLTILLLLLLLPSLLLQLHLPLLLLLAGEFVGRRERAGCSRTAQSARLSESRRHACPRCMCRYGHG